MSGKTIFYHCVGVIGLIISWFLYSISIGFDDRDGSFAHNMIVVNLIALFYCLAGLFIHAKQHGFQQPMKLFFNWFKGAAQSPEGREDTAYFDKNKGWMYGLYFCFICLVANAVISFLRMVYFFYTTPL